LLQPGRRDHPPELRREAAQADFALPQRTRDIGRRLHAELHASDQFRVLRIHLPVDPPVEVADRAHLAAVVGERVADLADHRLGRAHRQELHEVDLVRVDVERDVRKQLVIQPFASMRRGQVVRLREQILVGALRRVLRNLLDEIAFHSVDMLLRLDLVVAGEEAREPRVADRNVQVV